MVTSHDTRFSDGPTRYHEYVAAHASFNAYEDAFKKANVLLNGVNLNTSKYQYPDMSAVEATLGKRADLMDAYINANRLYYRGFRDSNSGEPLLPNTLIDPDTVDWKAILAGSISWIEECINVHEDCGGAWTGELPSRVIDVGHHDGHEDAKLIETAKTLRGKYVALSYCWGDTQPLTTTTKTLKERQSGISLSICPQTIQDAILACRELKCRYLWIDALCIIQDDAKDWAAEASKMRDVYRNSWVTLVAEAAKNTTQGFLRGRPRDESVHFDDPKPLHSRGWCLQEHLLAPRKLIYHIDNVSFACQCIPDEVLSGCRIRATGSSNKNTIWENIITEYSNRKLTKEKDVLPALSGLASEFCSIEKDVYLAGLWKSRLLEGLLWKRDGYVSYSGPFKYRAPSWSWAAHKCPISYYTRNQGSRESYLAKVLRAETILNGIDHFGAVLGGYVVIRGFLRQGQIIQRSHLRKVREEDSFDFWLRRDDHNPEGYPHWIFGAEALCNTTGVRAMRDKSIHRIRNRGSKEIFVDVYLDDQIPSSQKSIEEAFLLLIKTDIRQDGGQDDLGIVLTLSDDRKTYQRIGLFLARTIDRGKLFVDNDITVKVI